MSKGLVVEIQPFTLNSHLSAVQPATLKVPIQPQSLCDARDRGVGSDPRVMGLLPAVLTPVGVLGRVQVRGRGRLHGQLGHRHLVWHERVAAAEAHPVLAVGADLETEEKKVVRGDSPQWDHGGCDPTALGSCCCPRVLLGGWVPRQRAP